MVDVLIRDVPDDVLRTIDADAKRQGLSRSEYLRRSIERTARTPEASVTVADLETFTDLGGPRSDEAGVGTTWLSDKSAFARLASCPDAEEWAGRIERGLVRVSTTTLLEIGFSSRSGDQLRTP